MLAAVLNVAVHELNVSVWRDGRCGRGAAGRCRAHSAEQTKTETSQHASDSCIQAAVAVAAFSSPSCHGACPIGTHLPLRSEDAQRVVASGWWHQGGRAAG